MPTYSESGKLVRIRDLADASNKTKTKITEVNTTIGNLSDLTTTDKSSIVAAINEIKESGGNGGQALSFDGIDCGEIVAE